MSDTVILALAAAVPLALAGAFLYYGSRIRKRLRPKEASRLLYEIELLNSKSDSERLVGYDKVLDHLLSFLGYSGTLGEKLKKR
ncbi:MAG: hypothetical protein QG650_745, partial [Patescibacteria group bacterium]|nr:hypothetical protein [Patescibacteria group bacterium]